MKTILIDNNALISYITDRNNKQSDIMLDIFDRAGKLEFQICIVSNVIAEFVYVLQKIGIYLYYVFNQIHFLKILDPK